jgi:hypothetical protein
MRKGQDMASKAMEKSKDTMDQGKSMGKEAI